MGEIIRINLEDIKCREMYKWYHHQNQSLRHHQKSRIIKLVIYQRIFMKMDLMLSRNNNNNKLKIMTIYILDLITIRNYHQLPMPQQHLLRGSNFQNTKLQKDNGCNQCPYTKLIYIYLYILN